MFSASDKKKDLFFFAALFAVAGLIVMLKHGFVCIFLYMAAIWLFSLAMAMKRDGGKEDADVTEQTEDDSASQFQKAAPETASSLTESLKLPPEVYKNNAEIAEQTESDSVSQAQEAAPEQAQEAVPEQAQAAAPETASSSTKSLRRLSETYYDSIGNRFDAKYHYGFIPYDGTCDLSLMTPVEFELGDSVVNVVADGELCGSFPHKKYYDMITDWKRRAEPFLAQIDGENPNTLEICFFKPHPSLEDYKSRQIESRVYKLLGTTKAEYEAYASCAEIDEEFDVTYDILSERYETCAGYLPKDVDNFLDGDDSVGFVESVDINSNGTPIIKLRVFRSKL